jgi:hypothetical protein
VVKSLWTFLTRDNLWRHILVDKYIVPGFILDWIHKRKNPIVNVSNQWKDMTLAFPIIG